MPGVHAKFSPSGAHRWMACPGSLIASLGVEDKTSYYAAEGTCAHDLAERALKEGEDIGRFMGETIEVDGFDITVTDDMLDYVQVYIDYVEEQRSHEIVQAAGIEDTVYVRKVHDDVHGTADAWVYFNGDTKVVEMIDLKFGRGEMVSPERNPQLMIYGLGVVEELVERFEITDEMEIDFVRLTIIQPRAKDGDTIKSWTVSMEDLRDWREQELAEAVKAASVIDAPRVAGDKQCKWCPLKATCPALRGHVNEVAQMEFTEGHRVLPHVNDLPMDRLVLILQNRKLIEEWLSEVEGHALSLLQGGHKVPGYKLVEGRTQRKWKDPEAAFARLKKSFKLADISEQKLLSFTKIEKVSKHAKKLVGELTTKPEGAPTIAPESDSRPAIASAVEQFDAIEDQSSTDIDDLLG